MYLKVIFLLMPCCLAYNILLIPMPGYSHVTSFLAMGKKLVEGGNKVHFLADLVTDEKIPLENRFGVNFIKYGQNIDRFKKLMKGLNDFFFIAMSGGTISMGVMKEALSEFIETIENDMLIFNEKMMNKLEKLKFDLCVVDVNILIKSITLIPHRLGIPYITYSDTLNPWLVRTPWFPSVQPHPILFLNPNYKHAKFSFLDRLFNTIAFAYFQHLTIIRDCSPETIEAYRRFGQFADLDELTSKSLLFFTTDDPIIEPSLPRTANIVHVGGLTTELLSHAPLPKPYLQFIRQSNNTVVVSFGSHVSLYPDKLYETFIETFRKLHQFQFIWRAEKKNKFETPANVFISNWIPQNNLLADSSVKAFVTHSGNNGLFETLKHGVPVVAVPMHADQFRNTERVVSRGYGVRLDLRNLTSHEFTKAILEVTTNSRYKENIQKASDIFNSAPQSPAQRAAFWIEHVIKFGGDHLKPAGNELYVWQYLLLDVLLFLCVCVLVVFFGVLLCVKHVVMPHLSARFVKRDDKKEQ